MPMAVRLVPNKLDTVRNVEKPLGWLSRIIARLIRIRHSDLGKATPTLHDFGQIAGAVAEPFGVHVHFVDHREQ